MPMPYTYRHASTEFAAYLALAKDLMDLQQSDTMAYTATHAVFLAFRARASLNDTLRFADILPAVLRAILVEGWHPAPPQPWGNRADQVAEVMAFHRNHNLTPPQAIDAVAEAIAAQVLAQDWDACLAAMAPEAATFWHVPPARRRPVSFP